MNREQTKTTEQPRTEPVEKLFTVAEANSALVLIRKIVSDIVSEYRRLMSLRDEEQELASHIGQTNQLEQLGTEIERSVESLTSLHTELTDTGCVLKDWARGLVDFPAEHEDRRIWLCWRMDEPQITHWHELDAGFAGRKPVAPALI